jgi:hypothetical protein
MESDQSTRQDEKSSAGLCPGIIYRDHYPGRARRFLKEKVAWNFRKWGEDGERLEIKRTKGLTNYWLTPCFHGADEQDRTADLLITNQLLYRLSYIGFVFSNGHTRLKFCLSIVSHTPCQVFHAGAGPESALTFGSSLI